MTHQEAIGVPVGSGLNEGEGESREGLCERSDQG